MNTERLNVAAYIGSCTSATRHPNIVVNEIRGSRGNVARKSSSFSTGVFVHGIGAGHRELAGLRDLDIARVRDCRALRVCIQGVRVHTAAESGTMDSRKSNSRTVV